MPAERLTMRKIREILRMNALGLSTRQIGHSLQVARSSVGEYLKRAAAAGLSWPLPEELDEMCFVKHYSPKKSSQNPHEPMGKYSYLFCRMSAFFIR